MKGTRPNILWICTDQQRYDTLGCYGNEFVSTPHIDSLARNGALMRNAFCQSPVCTPSRVSFLTGRYPVTARGRQNGANIPSSERTLPRHLKDYGYTCGLSGKLHLSACHPRSGALTMEPRIDDGYDEFRWSHDTQQIWANSNEYHRWLRGKGKEFETAPSPESQFVFTGMPEDFHQTTWCVEEAVDFIKRYAVEYTPWLYSVNIFDPHHPFDAPRSYFERYLEFVNEIPLPNYRRGEEDEKPIWQRIDHKGAYGGAAGFEYPEMTSLDHRCVRASYWAMCDLIDHQVGRLIEALESTGQRDDTIVIFMSDHGEMLGDHGIYLKGPYFYEPAIHVPLVINWPDKVIPGERQALVELLDLPQTILDLVGAEAHPSMQGSSFADLLTTSNYREAHKSSVYCEYYNAMPWHRDPLAYATTIRSERWKLSVAHNTGTGELYDLHEDPSETTNCWDSMELSQVKTKMLVQLTDRMALTADPQPPRLSSW